MLGGVTASRKKIQDGGRKTGNIYISASKPDRNAVPTAIPTFSVPRNSMALVWMLGAVTESRKKFKMAAAKPEVLISQLLNHIETPFQRLTPIFGVHEFNEAIPNIVRCNRKSVIQDGGRQIGNTYISASNLDKIGTKLKRLNRCFRAPETQWHYCSYCPM